MDNETEPEKEHRRQENARKERLGDIKIRNDHNGREQKQRSDYGSWLANLQLIGYCFAHKRFDTIRPAACTTCTEWGCYDTGAYFFIEEYASGKGILKSNPAGVNSIHDASVGCVAVAG